MALRNCPECGKEQLKKYITFAGICAVAIILVVTIYNITAKVHTPFEKFKRGMTIEEVHKIFGEPDNMDDPYKIDYDAYYDVKFLGLTGKVIVYYDSNGEIIDSIYWHYNLKDEEKISDYSGFINRATKFFTKAYDAPSIETDGMTLWLDSVGGDYSLHLLDHSSIPSVNSEIMIRYKP